MEEFASQPKFKVQKRLFVHDYHVVAKFADGTCVDIVSFCDRSVAEYWIEVESTHWQGHHVPISLAA